MKERLRELPEALQKVVIYRAAAALVSLLLFAVILIVTREIEFALPCIVLAVYLIVNTVVLIYNCIRNRYVTVTGECMGIERTRIRKKIKSVTFRVDDKVLVVHTKRKMRKFDIGDRVIVYISEKTPVYEQDGGYGVYDFYAIEVNRKV